MSALVLETPTSSDGAINCSDKRRSKSPRRHDEPYLARPLRVTSRQQNGKVGSDLKQRDGLDCTKSHADPSRSWSAIKKTRRNACERARTSRICEQIEELRSMLVQAGMGKSIRTQASVLSAVLEYIRLLQQNNQTMEMECQKLRDVPSFVNPRQERLSSVDPGMSQQDEFSGANTKKDLNGFHYIVNFDYCPVGMALATPSSSLVHGNCLFCQMTQLSQDKLKELTIFHLTARDHFSYALKEMGDLLSGAVLSVELPATIPGLGMRISPATKCDIAKSQGKGAEFLMLVTLVQMSLDDGSTTAADSQPSSCHSVLSEDNESRAGTP